MIALCAVLCGGQTAVDMAEFGKAKDVTSSIAVACTELGYTVARTSTGAISFTSPATNLGLLGLLLRLLIGAGGKGLITLVPLEDGSILVLVAVIGGDPTVLGAIVTAFRSDC